MPQVRTLYDPTEEIGAAFVVEYSPDVYYHYAAAVDGKHWVSAIVYDMPGNSFVVNAEQAVLDSLSSTVPYPDPINPLFDITIKFVVGRMTIIAVAIAPNPTEGTYFGHEIIERVPSSTTWEDIRRIEYQIEAPEE